MTYKPDIMIYHANCADGFGAAWAAWMKWGNAVEYIPASYGQEPPEVLGKHVLIGDFSYKRAGIDAMLQGAASVVILDHHETAEAELEPFRFHESSPGAVSAADTNGMLSDLAEIDRPPCLAVFDMNRSGARMVWDFCFPGEEAPVLIDLIEDRDLWRFKLPVTKAFGVWLRCEPFDFQRWKGIAAELEVSGDHESILGEARAMQRFFDQKVAEIAKRARPGTIDGHAVMICNCPPEFSSEVGHWLLDGNPFLEFVACYSDGPKARGYSLRSDDTRMNVAEIARKFGGGGHRNAAGFSVPLP